MRSLATLVLLASLTAHAQPPPEMPTPETPLPVKRGARERHWIPIVSEVVGIFAVGQLWYFRHGADGNADDWDQPWALSSFTNKLTGEAWRYDDNGFVTNSVKHPIMFGAPVHTLARLHGFRLWEAFAISTASSLLWETVGEIREYGSINDLLSTSPGGLSIGEALYQIIEHPRATEFEIRTGVEALDADVYGTVGVRARLDRKIAIAIDHPFDHAGRAWQLESRALLGGYTKRSGPEAGPLGSMTRGRDVDDAGDGAELHIDGFAAFEYVHKWPRESSEYDTFANTLAGPSVSYAIYRRGVQVTGTLDASLDFAMVKPQAFTAWREMHPTEIVRGALEDNRHRYYYAFGTTVEPRLEVGYRGATLGGRVRASYFNSVEGRDRWLDQSTTEIKLQDTRTRATAWLGYAWRGAALTLEAELESRWGRVDEATSRLAQRRLSACAGVRF